MKKMNNKTEVEVFRKGLQDLKTHVAITYQDENALKMSSIYRIICMTLDKAKEQAYQAKDKTFTISEVEEAFAQGCGLGTTTNGEVKSEVFIKAWQEKKKQLLGGGDENTNN